MHDLICMYVWLYVFLIWQVSRARIKHWNITERDNVFCLKWILSKYKHWNDLFLMLRISQATVLWIIWSCLTKHREKRAKLIRRVLVNVHEYTSVLVSKLRHLCLLLVCLNPRYTALLALNVLALYNWFTEHKLLYNKRLNSVSKIFIYT